MDAQNIKQMPKTMGQEILAEAQKELIKERADEAKKFLKTKYRDLANAQKIVDNVQREIDDYVQALEQEQA